MQIELLAAAAVIILVVAVAVYFLFFSRKPHPPEIVQEELVEVYNDKNKARLTFAFFRFDGKNYFFDSLLKNNSSTHSNARVSVGKSSAFYDNLSPNQTEGKQLKLENEGELEVVLEINDEPEYKAVVDFRKVLANLRKVNALVTIEQEKILEKPSSKQIAEIEDYKKNVRTKESWELEELGMEERELEQSYLRREIGKEVFDQLNTEIQKKKIKLRAAMKKR